MSMSEWDRKYHRRENPKLKTTLISIAVVAALFIGLAISERIAFSTTFPASSEYIEIDGNTFSVEIIVYQGFGVIMGGPTYGVHGINILRHTNFNDEFPSGVNATRAWLIPTEGGIWPWKDYEIFSLELESSNPECACYAFIKSSEVRISSSYPYFDAIVEVNSSAGNLYYISAESEHNIIQL